MNNEKKYFLRYLDTNFGTTRNAIMYFYKSDNIHILSDRHAAKIALKSWDRQKFAVVKLALYEEYNEEENFIKFIEYDRPDELFNEIIIYQFAKANVKNLPDKAAFRKLGEKVYVTFDEDGKIIIPYE